ncbi:GntR family transcriptional regulator [Actinoplanes sp. CA-142083]|uniref:GntR family transcriptional regulator n=1 Tax=Actinoplanes sp. CA-142083 TaxID=3239903 RepID=UPI003D932994
MSTSGPPPYRQIAAGLRDQILDGSLPAGAKLPSQNELAARHHVARATVQSALRTLRNDGLITARKGAGHYVTGGREAAAPAADGSRCPAFFELDAEQLAWLELLSRSGDDVTRVLRCELEYDHVGPHACLGRRTPGDTEWWVLWTLQASEIDPLRLCPAKSDPGDNGCLLFRRHEGRHSHGAGYW